MSFSDKYKTTLKISNTFTNNKGMEDHLQIWSYDVVNSLYEFFGSASDQHFKVVVTIDPNPSSMKGVDQCKIEVWQTQNRSDPGFKPFIKIMSQWGMHLSECIKDINEKIDILTKKNTTEVIELNGKKYRLTEIE